jgi:hypothetical protein
VSLIDQGIDGMEQLFDIVKVEARRRFVEDKQDMISGFGFFRPL